MTREYGKVTPEIVAELRGAAGARNVVTDDKDTMENYSYDEAGQLFGHMPDVDALRRSRLKKKTLFEMPDEPDILACRAEYLRLAEVLWTGGEASAPAPLPDRAIFELLGFD